MNYVKSDNPAITSKNSNLLFLKKLHYLSGIIISVFVVAHLINHLISLVGIENHIDMMVFLRKIYRNPIIEVILLMGIALQVFSGIKLYLSKRKMLSGFFEKIQIWSGLYLAFFFVAHVGAVMAGRFIQQLDTNFYFGVAGLNAFPAMLYFIPYYGLAVLSFFGHIAAIHLQKMQKSVFGFTPIQQARLILYLGIFVLILIYYGATGGFAGIEIPEEYKM